MNLSDLVTRIKIKCGIYTIALPFENPDQAIVDVIQNITLHTFSLYHPYFETYHFALRELQRVDKCANYETYLLPDIFQERNLLYIRDVRYEESDISGVGYWGGGIPLLHGNMLNQGILSNAGMLLTNRMVPKMTFKFDPPRKVTLYNILASSKVVFECALSHDKNLASIPPIMEEDFYDLSVLDVQDMLYQSMKHYDNLQTVYGNIQIRMDEWQQAASDRKTLLEKWENLYHIDIMPFIYA